MASLDGDKGEDIVVIDLRGRSSMADHMVIVTGQSTRQVAAMAEHLAEKLKSLRLRVALEGLPQADWVLLDAGDVIVHLFRPEVRGFYNLERMWAAPRTAGYFSLNIVLVTVGRFRVGPEKALFEHYQKRLSWSLRLKEIEEKRPLPTAERILREAALVQAALPKGAITVALDERGKTFDSAAFAALIAGWRDSGRQDIAFLIGGADGHAESIRQSADMQLSLGLMTWPHMLVRGLVAEQLYRAESILANHPYHRF